MAASANPLTGVSPFIDITNIHTAPSADCNVVPLINYPVITASNPATFALDSVFVYCARSFCSISMLNSIIGNSAKDGAGTENFQQLELARAVLLQMLDKIVAEYPYPLPLLRDRYTQAKMPEINSPTISAALSLQMPGGILSQYNGNH